ncbi:unnamed protein product [Prunus armeniaca]|uniref:Uncharacterized protein n=1 Tax=Prunus armeniaca TaxID=36596 RepID=A0A6J5XJR5_PRUAR|nr:unnamed protein product [Prunus armeniaca]
MRRGAKRKASQKEAENHKESSKAANNSKPQGLGRRRGLRRPSPNRSPNTWRTLGTSKIYGRLHFLLGLSGINWTPFTNSSGISPISNKLLKKGGSSMTLARTKSISSVVLSVVSPFPPSDKIGINSVQREAEEIIPMKQMKMDWIPYIPLENRDSQVDRLKSQIFILGCTQRRAALKHMKIDRLKKFEYCLPYFYQPFKEDELEQSTEVPIMFPGEPKPVYCEFDWELDELEEFTDKLIEEEELSADQKDAFKEFLKEKVREQKKNNREAREARRKAIEEMSEEAKAAFENMRFYKFYPVQTPDTPDISNVKVVMLLYLAVPSGFPNVLVILSP